MKNLFFLIAAALMIVSATPAAAQLAAPTNEEAKLLVRNTRSKLTAIDSLINKITVARDGARRRNAIDSLKFFNDALQIARQTRGLGERIVNAGETMPSAKLEGFKAEAERLNIKLEDLLVTSNSATAAGTIKQCLADCDRYYSKWYMILNRALCKLGCYLGL